MAVAHSVHHPIFARAYGFLSRRAERELGPRRDELLDGVRGRVLEVGAGNGLNFAHYPPEAEEVVAVEPEDYLRHLAERAAASAAVAVRVQGGLAEALPFAEAQFDVAVVSLVLCSVGDPAGALGELRRVLRPGGELRFFEHVRGQGRNRARMQEALDRSGIWPFVAGGCHCSRDTVAAIEAAGFTIERVRQFDLPPSWGWTNPMVIGAARSG